MSMELLITLKGDSCQGAGGRGRDSSWAKGHSKLVFPHPDNRTLIFNGSLRINVKTTPEGNGCIGGG